MHFWDIHRHRLAPSAACRLTHLIDSDQVERMTGHVLGFDLKGPNLSIQLKERSSGRIRDLEVSAVVNCTGPNYDLSELSSPLVTQLRKTGQIQQDRLKLGLLVDDDYQIIDINNRPISGLFYVGPMLKAKYWESIAVPELRNHAFRLARHLMFVKH
jgi:uncharacterized NAD(P)/FAD-binding protein YdhS